VAAWRSARGAIAAALLLGCAAPIGTGPRADRSAGSAIKDTSPRAQPPAEAREEPPVAPPAPPFRFRAPAWIELPSGLKIAAVSRPGQPLVEIRVIVAAGAAADGDRPGVAALTGELLREDSAGRLAALGAALSADTTLDATVIRLSVPRERLPEALGLLGAALQRPRFDPADLTRIKRRAVEQRQELELNDGRWAALAMLHREIFRLPAERHPYSSLDATPEEIEKVTAEHCRAFHRRHFTPSNTALLVVGDTTPDAVRAAADKAFRGRTPGSAPALSLTDPMPPEALRITLVDRPRSSQSDIYVGFLGPARDDKDWPAFEVASQVLGGAAIAGAALSMPMDVSRGPIPLLAYATVPPVKTGLALQALLDRAERLAATAPDPEDVEAAARSLNSALAARMQTAGGIADELARLRGLGLPDDHLDGLWERLRDVTPALVTKVAGEVVRSDHAVVVVAGDAEVIGPLLSRFGQVKVVDPTHDFERRRSIPANPEAPIEPVAGERR
jgi:predicted Zn-dependent peptidase